MWGDSWILGLDAEYRWALIGSPDREYLWILSRTPSLDAALFGAAVSPAREQGFEISRLERTPQ